VILASSLITLVRKEKNAIIIRMVITILERRRVVGKVISFASINVLFTCLLHIHGCLNWKPYLYSHKMRKRKPK